MIKFNKINNVNNANNNDNNIINDICFVASVISDDNVNNSVDFKISENSSDFACASNFNDDDDVFCWECQLYQYNNNSINLLSVSCQTTW